MSPNFKRARGEQEKAVRVEQIIEKTLALYETIGYDKITFSEIAKGMDFSRINLYHYFESKEDIFLEITRRESEAFLSDVRETFTGEKRNADQFVKTWADLILRHARVVELYVLLNATVLRNVSEEKHRAFQAYLDRVFVETSYPVAQNFPMMSEKTALQFSLFEIYYAMGLMPITNRQKEAGIHSDTDDLDFHERYIAFLSVVLKGLLQ